VKTESNDLLKLWLEHAREFVGETSYLRHRVPINYNQWVEHVGYRRKIASELELRFSDRGVNDVPRFGGGSSFDDSSFHGSAHEMSVTERWRQFIDDPVFRAHFRYPEIHEYARRIFGPLPAIEMIAAKN
jgi:hypothetical protein